MSVQRHFTEGHHVKTSRSLWVPLLILLAAPGGVVAQSNVESPVHKLEETIRALESRVGSLEDQLRERSALAPVPSDKVNWRKLQMGMSEGNVEKLLGSPSKVDAGSFTIWYYGQPGGDVTFDGKSRTVMRWHEP